MKKLILIVCSLLCTLTVAAQSITVQGTVTSADDGEPLPGVTVMIKGTFNGISTDLDGGYKIAVPKGGGILVFSYIGYKNREVKVSPAATVVDVALESDAMMLDEVVAIGYGVMRKSDLTGAVASISADQLKKTPAAGLDQALQGRAAGVTVNANSGQPGAAADVRIRGIGTVNDSSPIYVVDGVITSDINYLNANDIASTEILKDASSTAIYGSRGANGVIIITTKNGSANSKINIDFNAYVGIQNRWNKLDLMGTDEFSKTLVAISGSNSERKYFEANGLNEWLAMYRIGNTAGMAVPRTNRTPDGLDYSKIDTDWQDEVFRKNAVIQNYHLSLSGGSDKTTYALSGSWFSQDGTIMGSSFERLTLRANSTYTVSKWLKVGENLSLVTTKSRWAMVNSSSPGASILSAAIAMSPWDPTHYPEGAYDAAGTDLSGCITPSTNFKNVVNPFSMVEHSHPDNRGERWIGNIFLEIQPVKGLTFRSEVSMDLAYNRNREFKEAYFHSNYDKMDKNFLSSSMERYLTMHYDNTLTYRGDWGRHSLTAMVGQTTEEWQYYSIGGSGSSILNPTPNNWYISNTTADRNSASDSAQRTRMVSLLGRLHYAYDNRYLITLNFRADGSSKFPNHLWGYFPSTAVAWRISEEKWLRDSDILDNLKLRAGWGQIGNDKIAQGSFTMSMASSTGWGYGYPFGGIVGSVSDITPGATIATIVNQGGMWESTEQWNVGVDFGLWGGKLTGTVDAFLRDTKDMLLTVKAPGHVGTRFDSTANVGTVRNQGIEITLGHSNRIGELSYAIGGNVSFIKNELTALNGGERVDGTYNMCDVGLPLFALWGYKYEGIYRTEEEILSHLYTYTSETLPVGPGSERFADLNRDGKIGNEDLTQIGNPFPWLTYGLNFDFEWKGIDLGIFFQGVYGNDIFNGVRMRTEGTGNDATLSTAMRDVWTTSNPDGSIPSPKSPYHSASSSRYVEDGSYLRLKNLTIGYTLPEKWTKKMRINRWRFYVSMNNLFTVTGYTGYDPEVGTNGLDWGNYPQSRTFMFGTNINF
ncbi:MAG: TonB-dependent receptor [Alistipes sp.]|nr:TonB-dependent receptor [Alistipes sp.]